ncbi:uncharacterized protein LOC128312082 [Acinonyx jubatus]|uniref:Uncharacterized protein LOC128312082 n=1 Tax=Acinonyx jubatus TaxID=32536 RepID=A0ABM3NM06_ACIJB|nr:uncharacterized protein LOC128312082 [Acinonyx jubatus]
MNCMQSLPPPRFPVCSGTTLNFKADPRFFAPWQRGARWDPSPAHTEPFPCCTAEVPQAGCGAQRPLKGVSKAPRTCTHTSESDSSLSLTCPVPVAIPIHHPLTKCLQSTRHRCLQSTCRRCVQSTCHQCVQSTCHWRTLHPPGTWHHPGLSLTSAHSPSPLPSPWPGPLPPPRSPGLYSCLLQYSPRSGSDLVKTQICLHCPSKPTHLKPRTPRAHARTHAHSPQAPDPPAALSSSNGPCPSCPSLSRGLLPGPVSLLLLCGSLLLMAQLRSPPEKPTLTPPRWPHIHCHSVLALLLPGACTGVIR